MGSSLAFSPRLPPAPLRAPDGYHCPQRCIRFRHPGYPDTGYRNNVLLDLYAYDHSSGGLHYGTAFLACAIVAVNSFNGYLSETRAGAKLESQWDDLLLKDDYYFHVPPTPESMSSAHEYQYPVYPTFQHWTFPHTNMPVHWPKSSPALASTTPPSASNAANHVLNRDQHCLVTSSEDYIESAHLCPREEAEWFGRSGMMSYNKNKVLGNYIVDDISNAIALRPDIHKAFDDRKFVITCKDSTWLLHFLGPTSQLGDLYHNTPIKLHDDVSPFFLFVRFAWAIFPSLRPFLQNGVPRRVCIRVETQNGILDEVKSASVKELTGLINPPKSRNPSPTKRQRQTNEGEVDAWEDGCTSESRGRKRHRTSSPEQTNIGDIGVSQSTASRSATRVASQEDWEKDLTDFEKLQLKYVRAQRPQNPELICCDYNEAERACRLGLPGKREFGGYLCMECRGLELAEEMPELPDGWMNEEAGESASE